MKTTPSFSWEIIVVDNNSSDHTKTVVQKFAQSVTVNTRYIFEEKQGLCYARNTGVSAATGNIIAFTDDDVTVDSRWLWSIKSSFEKFDCIGLGGKIIPVWSHEKPPWLALQGPYKLMNVFVSYDLGPDCRVVERTNPPVGANYAFRPAAFKKYGFYRTDLDRVGNSLLGGGDTEFVRRIINNKEIIMYDPNAIVYHPVEEKRLRKEFFRLWYFDYGRALVRLGSIPPDAVSYFHLPRYLFRLFVTKFLRWIFSLRKEKRFYYQLQCYQICGEMTELYSFRKRKAE